MRHWKVKFDVVTQAHGEKPVTHKRTLLVMAEDEDAAEAIAYPHATLFNFGPKVLAIEWRQTSTVSLPLDLTPEGARK